MTDRTVWGLGIFDETSRYDEMKRKTIDRTDKNMDGIERRIR